MRAVLEPREAFGVRRVHRRFRARGMATIQREPLLAQSDAEAIALQTLARMPRASSVEKKF